MQVKDQVDNLSVVHPLLNVLSQTHLIDADLVRQTVQLVLETKLRGPILDAKVDGPDDSTSRQRLEGLDTALRFGMHRAVVVNVEGF